MKKILTLLVSLSLVIFISCENDNSDTDGLSTDGSVFFTITFNGKTITQNGSKSTDPIYNTLLKSYVSAKITTDEIANESNIYMVAFGSGGYKGGLNNHNFTVNIRINKVGDSLGIYNNLVGECSIVDSADPFSVYNIDKENCTITITYIDSQYVNGTFGFNLIIDNKLVAATGFFKLNNI